MKSTTLGRHVASWISLSLALGLLGALCAGCATNHSAATPPTHQAIAIDITYDELLGTKFITRAVTLAVGDTLTVTLASNPSTGFSWTAQTQIADPAVIQQTSHDTAGAASPMPGAAGTEIWQFTAVKAGTTAINADYGQPWPGGTKKAWTFTASVTVQ